MKLHSGSYVATSCIKKAKLEESENTLAYPILKSAFEKVALLGFKAYLDFKGRVAKRVTDLQAEDIKFCYLNYSAADDECAKAELRKTMKFAFNSIHNLGFEAYIDFGFNLKEVSDLKHSDIMLRQN